jgi:iron complex outermembrane receptor protein
MTIGAAGVKVYGNIPNATIINASLSLSWNILPSLLWSGKLTYSLGRDDQGDTLPLVAPLGYTSSLRWLYKALSLQLSMTGAARQSQYGEKYGESITPPYTVFNVSAEYPLEFSHIALKLRAGVENLLDRRYSTYADWNNIPQKGRNIYVSASMVF